MTTQINVYLHFSGESREAMTFYRDCIGGELFLQTIGETPMASQMPADVQKDIMHSSLTKGNLLLMASDMSDAREQVKGNNISLSLNCETVGELQDYFGKLSEGGKVTHPIHEFFAGTMGNLTDKFGISWMFYAEKTNG